MSARRRREAVVINTCIVIGATERHMIRRMRIFADKELYLTGCMPLARMDAILPVCTPRIIHPDSIRERYGSAGTLAEGAVGVVQIASGCVGSCSYCITRRARGAIASEPIDAVLDAVGRLVADGAKEIQLTGQDVSAWGIDRGERLPDLLREIVTVPGRYRLRLGMMNPATVFPILDDLAEAYAGEKIFRFLHLPVQSGSDTVLGRMQRGYRAADVLAIVRRFRERYPDMIISSDFIAGFPGETDADFQQSLDLLREAAFAKVNITRYSRRPGTPAAREKDLTDYVRKAAVTPAPRRGRPHLRRLPLPPARDGDADRGDREEGRRIGRLQEPGVHEHRRFRGPPPRIRGTGGHHREETALRHRAAYPRSGTF